MTNFTTQNQSLKDTFEAVYKCARGREFVEYLEDLEVEYLRNSAIQESEAVSRQFQGRALAIKDILNKLEESIKRNN